MANKGQFYGVGLKKAKRRPNRPGGSPRKMHPYLRKEQYGTAAEAMLRANYDQMEEQGNKVQLKNGRMSQKQATGQLSTAWKAANRKIMGAKSVVDYIRKNNVSAATANKALVGMGEISFGADPKQR